MARSLARVDTQLSAHERRLGKQISVKAITERTLLHSKWKSMIEMTIQQTTKMPINQTQILIPCVWKIR